ncbi:cytochrome c-type biogenesis protein [Rhizosaccharibacter radicis]|uniref:Cytochrome c-type biogenesis protein n=1 Tax=Rhizosaccharibacter radicis TaxID=2782605 RepID=A0ABT1VXP6_9PROT|nr:cytochrome c-type biogenesis protein CcmH [Acetobacteraceae bacterium KSS12]
MVALLAALAAGLAMPMKAGAVSDPSEMLADPAAERRAEHIGSRLRCLVCQNEDIEDSGADLARDLRHAVRARIAAGDSDRQVMDWMVARYGQFIRLQPRLDTDTLLLWGMPALALLAGGGTAALAARRRRPAPSPLAADEEERVSRLLEGDPS